MRFIVVLKMDRVVHLISLDMYIIPGKTTSGLDNNTDLNQLHWFKEKQTVTVKVLTFFFSLTRNIIQASITISDHLGLLINLNTKIYKINKFNC